MLFFSYTFSYLQKTPKNKRKRKISIPIHIKAVPNLIVSFIKPIRSPQQGHFVAFLGIDALQ